jgi:hypothetical protein
VLGDSEACHLQFGLELCERAAVTLKEQVKQKTTRRIGKRLEDPIVI